jgi:transcription antitermination factor NusG
MVPGSVTSNQLSVNSNQLDSSDYRSLVPYTDSHYRGLGGKGQEGKGAEKGAWLVLKTKVKCEKFVRDRLQDMGIEAFVPLRKRTALYQRKVKTYEHPLITTYTFVRFDKERRNQVLALPYVQGVLRMDGKDCTVTEQEIYWLQKISGTDLDVHTETLSLQTGDKVMLAYGQLAGMEGILVSQRSKHEVCVALESLGLQMVIQVDKNMVVKT